ncbi:hypothetical protein QFC19_003380 [Naganishia cerealis]|uniref:Uncharacterized protein n=1 Tax=Naganishia cerealis TaxID=610337 RepID=A0ACC2W5C0_9TREE|nr:hypothetical protein QFC19_003380 [Naganishia cerealis]
MTPEQAERKAKAERAKKLLAKRKKDKEGLAVSSKASSEIGGASPRASIDVPASATGVEGLEEQQSKGSRGEEARQDGDVLKEYTANEKLVEKDSRKTEPSPSSEAVEDLSLKESKDDSAHKDEDAPVAIKPAQTDVGEQPAATTEEKEHDEGDQAQPTIQAEISISGTDHAVPNPTDSVPDSVKPFASMANDKSTEPEAEVVLSNTHGAEKKNKKKKKKGKTGGVEEKPAPSFHPEAEAPEEEDEPTGVDEGIAERMMADEVESQREDEQENAIKLDQTPLPHTLDVVPDSAHDSVPAPKLSSVLATEEPQPPVITSDSTILAAAQEELATLKTQLSVLSHIRDAATHLEEENTTLRASVDGLTERLERMEIIEAEHAERHAEVEALNEQLEAAEERAEEARQEAARGNRERENAERRAKEAEERLDRQRERESGLEVEVNRLKQAEKEDSEISLAGVREQHSEAVEKLDGLQRTYDSLKADQETLQASLTSTSIELESTRDRLSSTTAALTASEAQAQELSASVSGLTEARDALQTQLAKETKRCEQAVNQRSALLQDNQGLLAQLEEMRERNGELMKELVAATEERSALQASVKRLESEVEELKQAKENDSSEAERLKTEYETETRLRRETERDLETTRELLEQQSKTHSEQLAELQPRLEALTVGYSEIERELDVSDSTKDGIDDAESRTNPSVVVVREIQNLKAEIKRLGNEMDELRPAVKETDSQQEDPVALVQAQHALEISNYSSQLRSIESALHAESSRSHSLSKQITDLQAELFETKRQLQQRETYPSTAPSLVSYRLAPTTTMIDEKLPPSVRQKRRTALALLKARLTAAAGSAPGTPLNETDHRPDHLFRSQLSEDAVFWCPCCDGDLISL